MLYFFIRPFVRLTFRIFFSKIYLHHLDRIPLDRPVLIASNHPSAFLEACLLATHFPKSLHFLVRGDIFINKFIIWLLAQFHLTPIYRFSDGFKNMRANDATFNACYERLNNKEIIVVYAEGNTTQEKRLRPIQKGLARIAFGALDKYPDLDLCIVPLGVNYTHPNDFRSEVFVEVGHPIELKPYVEKYKADFNKAVIELTQEVETTMKPLIIHVNNDVDLELAEKLWAKNKAAATIRFLPVVERTGERFEADKKTADRINSMETEEKITLNQKIDLKGSDQTSNLSIKILTPFAFMGIFLNGLPLWIGHYISKSKVSRIEFFASVLVGTSMFLYFIYLAFYGLILWLLGFSLVLGFLVLFLTGGIYLYRRYLIEKEKNKLIQSSGSSNDSIRLNF